MESQESLRRKKLLASAIVFLLISLALSHLAGRAESFGVGDTKESQNLTALAVLAGLPATILGAIASSQGKPGHSVFRLFRFLSIGAAFYIGQVILIVITKLLSAS